MLTDDDLEAIRRRKMKLLMERAGQPKVPEPLANGANNPLTEVNFWQTIQQTKTALVDFYGEWCQPCKQLAPILAELAMEYKGKVYFAKVDIDRNPRITQQFQVQSVPNIFAFKNGRPLQNLPGLRHYNDYDVWINRLLQVT